jgi:hypothetical protein
VGTRTPSTPKPGTQAIRAKKQAPRDLNIRLERGSGKERIDVRGRATLTDTTFRFRTGRTGDQGADFFVHLPYDDLTSVELDASAASLTIEDKDGNVYRLHIGKHAPGWKEYMRKPDGRLTLFGVTPKTRLLVLPLPDSDFADELEACVPGASSVSDDTDNLQTIFFGAEHVADLKRIATLAARLSRPHGNLWVVFPTGRRGLDESQIAKAAAAAGMLRSRAIVLSKEYEVLELILRV